MEAHELRAMQASVKEQYKEYPESALVPCHAEGVVDMANFTITLEPRPHPRIAGLHAAVAGTSEFACSADLLLDALVGCAGVTLTTVATAMQIEVRNARVLADGHWDARGTLGLDRMVPVGLIDVTLSFDIDADIDETKRARLIQLVERYCVIAQTLQHPPAFTVAGAERSTHS